MEPKVKSVNRKVERKQLESLDEGFLDALKSFVGELLGVSQAAFDSAKAQKKVSLTPRPKPQEGQPDPGAFDPTKNPIDQLIAIHGMLSTVNHAISLALIPLKDLPKEAQKILTELEDIATGKAPGMEMDTLSGGTEMKDLYTKFANESYERLAERIAEAYGTLAAQIKQVEFADEPWYKKIMKIGQDAKPDATPAKTVENMAKTVGEIEKLDVVGQANLVVQSQPVEKIAKSDSFNGDWARGEIKKVKTEMGRYEIDEIKSAVKDLHEIVKQLDEAMGKTADIVAAAEEGGEEAEKSQSAVSTSIMSHFAPSGSDILREYVKKLLKESPDWTSDETLPPELRKLPQHVKDTIPLRIRKKYVRGYPKFVPGERIKTVSVWEGTVGASPAQIPAGTLLTVAQEKGNGKYSFRAVQLTAAKVGMSFEREATISPDEEIMVSGYQLWDHTLTGDRR